MVTVIAGGTTGIGRAIALERLSRGDRVVVIGRDPANGTRFLSDAERIGAGERAHHVIADLGLVADTRRAIDEVRGLVDQIDALVLCARYFHSTRSVTEEGLERTFALLYLSRFVLSHETMDLLTAAPAPVIVNVAGPGTGTERIRWDDLQAERDYDGAGAQAQGGQLNDLLGIGFTRRHPGSPVAYVLVHPGIVDTALAGDYSEEDAVLVAAMRRDAQPVDSAVQPILDVLDDRPAQPLSARRSGARLDIDAGEHGAAADRLFHLTLTALSAFTPAANGVSVERLHGLLDSPVFATVSTLGSDGAPHQSVVWVARDGDEIVFTIAEGSVKERNLRRDPRVSILVSPPTEPYTYAAVQGRAALRPDPAGELLDRLAQKYTGHDRSTHHTEAAAQQSRTSMTVVRVAPGRIIGRL